jgi:hypothetical protein
MYSPPAERNARPFPLSPAAAAPEDRCFMSSPAFLVGGAASVLCWTGIAMALLRFL